MGTRRETEREIPTDAIVENSEFQTRASPGDAGKLARNIDLLGQLSAVIVRPMDKNKYQMIAGQTRLLAMRQLGRTHIRARVLYDLTDAEARRISLAENIARKNLSTWDLAVTAARYREQGLTNAEIADAFGGVAIRTVQRYIAVSRAPEEYRAALESDKVSLNQVYEAIRTKTPLSELTGKQGKSVRYLRNLSRKRQDKDNITIQRRRTGEIIINMRFDPARDDLTQLLAAVKERLRET